MIVTGQTSTPSKYWLATVQPNTKRAYISAATQNRANNTLTATHSLPSRRGAQLVKHWRSGRDTRQRRLCPNANLRLVRIASFQQKQIETKRGGHTTNPRLPIGRAARSHIELPQHGIPCGAAHRRSSPGHRKSSILVPGGIISRLRGGEATTD